MPRQVASKHTSMQGVVSGISYHLVQIVKAHVPIRVLYWNVLRKRRALRYILYIGTAIVEPLHSASESRTELLYGKEDLLVCFGVLQCTGPRLSELVTKELFSLAFRTCPPS